MTKDKKSLDYMFSKYEGRSIQHHVFAKDTVLFKKGEDRHCAFLVNKGSVEIHGNDQRLGPDKLLCVINEGEIFGEMALVDSSPRSATAIVASTEADLFVIPREALYSRFQNLDPMITLLMSLLVEHYRTSRINLPESVKQETKMPIPSVLKNYDHMPKILDTLKNADQQRAIAFKEIKLEQNIKDGLKRKEFKPVFQPIVDLSTGAIVGFEALARWHTPSKGVIPPFEFIPVAERSGLVREIDMHILAASCEAMPRFLEHTKEQDFTLSVNLSGLNFGEINLVDTICEIVFDHNVKPENIKLEITESALIHDAEAAEKILSDLKKAGFHIALDDFGTGYSSLSYLHKFPIDDLKIDRAFISKIHESKKGMDIVRGIIALGRIFDLQIVAEGIETEKDAVALNGLDCDLGQGYLYAKPLPLADAIALLQK